MAVQRVFQKSSRRDAGQVLANGAVPLLLLLYWQRSPSPFGFYLYLAAIASATADTWATEIGVLSKSPPRFILNLRKAPSGTSGAVSLLGLASALLGAFAVSAVGFVVAAAFSLVPFRWWYLLVLTAAGFLAQIVDSLLGASLQGLYRCANCNRISEKKMHCQGHQASHISGWKWVNNDIVNVTSNVFGVLLCWIGVEVLL